VFLGAHTDVSCLVPVRARGRPSVRVQLRKGNLLEAAKGRVPDGDARVSFDADGRVTLYDLYRTIRTSGAAPAPQITS